ncbi:MAG: hypothetical protein HZC38_20740 [Chloroflexi bacterium]|nr:hypothetical protein [Chloroflexota bacterium]
MEDQEELIKEVFAQFGAAYYHSEVLHRGLCNIYSLATFDKVEDITRPRVEEKLAVAFSLTLGQMVEKTKELFPSDLQQRLEVALDKRNYLAHHFWFERNPLMFSEQGLLELRQELLELTDLFSKLDEAITEYFKPKRQAMGVTDELIQESFDKLIAGEPDEPLISQRLLKKQERIVRAWDVKVRDILTAQIFETEDGHLWQFCDVGLGWTRFEKPASDWAINERLKKYLPANINPRPSITEPWNYEFNLAKGAVLWVKRGKRERSYTWGIKASSKSRVSSE